jgi:LPXTG-motif cell wall-anchored protein
LIKSIEGIANEAYTTTNDKFAGGFLANDSETDVNNAASAQTAINGFIFPKDNASVTANGITLYNKDGDVLNGYVKPKSVTLYSSGGVVNGLEVTDTESDFINVYCEVDGIRSKTVTVYRIFSSNLPIVVLTPKGGTADLAYAELAVYDNGSYNTIADIEFVVDATHKTEWLAGGNSAFEDLIAKNTAGTVIVFADQDADGLEDGKLEGNIENYKGTVLPETGAEGTFLLIAGGALLAIVAAVFMVTRKKMSVYED